MMSTNNDDAPWAYWFIALMLWCLALYILALAVFLSLLLTVLCLFALRGPVSLGPVSIDQEKAAGLLALGVCGAIVVPVFLGFCQLFIGTEIAWHYFPQFFFGGYAAGLLGIGVLGPAIASGASRIAPTPEYLPSAPPQGRQLPSPETFRYASWDDEEAGR